MQKLHMRASIELDIPDDLFMQIIETASENGHGCDDIDCCMLPEEVRAMVNAHKFVISDWDDGGYCPGPWLECDAEGSGIYECDERGVRKKENAK